MNRLIICSCSIFAFGWGAVGAAQTTAADVQAHLNQLAAKIERKADCLLEETRHYRHMPQYRRMVAETVKLRNAAQHVRVTTFCRRSFVQLEEDLRILDRCFHQIEDFFDHVERAAARGRGHIHGNTRHVKVLLNDVEDCIHHMQDDVVALRRSFFGNAVLENRTFGNRGFGNSASQRIIIDPPIHNSRTIYRSDVYVPYGGGRHRADSRRSCDFDRSIRHEPRGNNLRIERGGFSLRIRL